ncbi:threonine ammonia-lyase [Longivirga aurantiaca]|uniref:threonine ammonia-lyase n=1 Tax=Longivirga aurantiaca TaxID=1837743 RepID=A0ABW1SY97_9ACTN
MIETVTVQDVEAARIALKGVARETPLRPARWLADKVGGPVDLKCENLQRAGSFKIRGAYTRMVRLSEEERARGVVAASAGNHAQGVALAASMLGISATVFMPVGAPLPKVAATRGYGAEIRFIGTAIDECLVAAQEFADETGAILIHPFDHKDIVAGQGTVGLEILEQRPDVKTIVVCTGGGGLLAGIAVAVKAVRPDVRIVGVQAAGAAAYPGSLAVHHPVSLASMSTMADGIAVGRPGDVPFALIDDLVDQVVVVDDETIARALVLTLERGKLVVEPAGAAGLAAVLDDPAAFEPPVVVVVSGGNVDPLLLLRVIRHGLAAAGRYSTLTVRMPDRPGSLASLLAALAAADANVVEVEHARADPKLHLDEVQIEVQVETRGPEHRDEVLARLAREGFHVTTG